jgi:iron complex outermembrane receptor protein
VGVIVDGLFQPSSTGQLIDTFDVEQIEVNRGPQGVLYGKNTTGGTIVVTRTKPTTERFGYAASAQAGRFNERILKGRVNMPLGETLAVKLGGTTREADGYFDNITRGGSAGDVDYFSYTGSVLWEPLDNVSVQYTYDKIKDEGDIPPQDPRYNGENPFVNEADFNEFQFLDTISHGLQVEWGTDWGTLTSITGWVQSTDTVGQDFDGSTRATPAIPLPQLHTNRDQDYDTFTQELRWAGDFGEDWSYQVGGFFMDTELDFQQGTNQVLQLPPEGFGLPAEIEGCFPAFGLVPNPNPEIGDALCQVQLYSVQISKEDTESLGVFGNVTWRPLDRVELSAGARYINDEKTFRTAFYDGGPDAADPLGPPRRPVGTPNLQVPRNSDSWNETIFKVSGSYALTDSNNVYASWAQGFRSGGFSARGIDPRFLAYDPESVDAYEIGSKNDFLDGRMRVNAAAFFTLLQDSQFSSIVTDQRPGSPGTNTIVNNAAGDTEIWGFEAEITALLSDHFTLIVTGGYQDNDSEEFDISSERVSYNEGTGTACNPSENPEFFEDDPNTCPTIEIGGGALGRAPEWNWSSTLVYGREIGADYFQASVTARGQDEFVITGGATATNPQSEDGYTLIDARLSYTWALQEENNLVLSVIGKNLTDEEYREQALPLGFNGGFQGWAPPMTWAVEVVLNH